MLESIPQTTSQENSPNKIVNSQEQLEVPPHLDVSKLMKEKNAYFVHMIQVTNELNVSENNKSGIDTQALKPADHLDILYAAKPTLSASSLRPNTNDGTFRGGFGVLFSKGEVESAEAGDSGSIATSLTKRKIFGEPKNTEKDISNAIDRPQVGRGKTYNEIVLKDPEVCGGFMKLSDLIQDRISYEENSFDYGVGGGEVKKKVGVLNLENVKEYGSITRNFDTPLSVLLEMEKRGKVFLMGEDNQMLLIQSIDEKTRQVRFSPIPILPKDIVDSYGDDKLNPYLKDEMVTRLSKKGITV